MVSAHINYLGHTEGQVLIMKEIWKDIDGFVGKYMVSNLGNVKSLNYNHTHFEKLLCPTTNHYGYQQLSLKSKSIHKTVYVHTLVAKAFIPNPLNKKEVNHIDGNKLNNCVTNLEWVTPKENTQHAIKTGLRTLTLPHYVKGADHYSSKQVIQYDTKGIFVKKWDCISDAARYYDCLPASIVNCCKGRTKTIKGYIWRTFDENDIPKTIDVPYNHKAKKQIYQYDLNDNLINIWNSYNEITNNTSYKRQTINNCCRGALKTAYGFKWKHVYI